MKPQLLIILVVVCLTMVTAACQQDEQLKTFQAEKIAEGFLFTEGPVWKDGALLFSDIQGNTVYRWSAEDSVRAFLKTSGRSNGLALDKEGRLILAQHEKRRLARLDENGVEQELVSSYRGKRLNSPNDLVVKSDGSIYFTDPPYGISKDQEELGFYGIYRFNADGGLILLDSSLIRPNGIAFAPGEKYLYVSDSKKNTIYRWRVEEDGTITGKEVFIELYGDNATDGLKVDDQGKIYATGPGGVWIIQPHGKVEGHVDVPGQVTNCGWGARVGSVLFVTTDHAIFRITGLDGQ